MANRNFANSRVYSGHVMPVELEVSIPIGASGAVGTIAGAYISSVTLLATGMYQIQLQDNYAGYYMGSHQFISPVTGSALAIDSVSAALTVGAAYQITTVGTNTDAAWRAIGVPAGVAIAVGVPFVALATGSGATGTGRVKAVAAGAGIDKVELIGNPNTTLAPVSATGAGALGGIITIQCLQAQIGAATTQGTALQYAAANPASGSTLNLRFLLSNSSVTIGGN